MKSQKPEVIISFEPEASFSEDFSGFVEDILNYRKEETQGLSPAGVVRKSSCLQQDKARKRYGISGIHKTLQENTE